MTPKTSAGLMMYRIKNEQPEVLLVHPGGPFFKNKDDGVWSIPKGEADEGESDRDQLLEVAKREFEEETGMKPTGKLKYLTSVKNKSGKMVEAWAFEGDCDPTQIKSNTILIDWPPRTGQKLEIPEVDRAGFFPLIAARQKLYPYQTPIIDALEKFISKDYP